MICTGFTLAKSHLNEIYVHQILSMNVPYEKRNQLNLDVSTVKIHNL